MCLRFLAIIFGLVFLFIGVAGFMPVFNQDGLLLGLFEVNLVHNFVHIGSGVIALLSSVTVNYARWYFRIFGVIYGLVAIAGFVNAGDLGVMHMNMADNVLHTVIAFVALYLGFLCYCHRHGHEKC